ncbi:MAG: hypothetical protein HUJ31_07360 [Pseudomonadales bacterium]|nr:hypothetical protein [Pseudomonadales bacterium]
MSQKPLNLVYKFGLAMAIVLFASSCASTAETDLRAMVEEAQQTAEAARDQAQSADDKASRALEAAQSAEQKASAAQSAAQSAQTCCDENRERLDRMFERSQQK